MKRAAALAYGAGRMRWRRWMAVVSGGLLAIGSLTAHAAAARLNIHVLNDRLTLAVARHPQVYLYGRIDADAPRPVLEILGRRMAVNDDEIKFRTARQERFADPHHLVVLLSGKRNAGENSGMDEQITSGARADGKVFEKGNMRFRDRFPHGLLQ